MIRRWRARSGASEQRGGAGRRLPRALARWHATVDEDGTIASPLHYDLAFVSTPIAGNARIALPRAATPVLALMQQIG
jgi:hypothetical protein